jgi:hypothetical protein
MQKFVRWRLADLKSATISARTATLSIAIHGPKGASMIRKLKSGQYRLYSRKRDQSTGKRRNLGTFSTMEKATQHEREVQYFKKH